MGEFPIFLQTMNITAAQIHGAIRTLLAGGAGYLKAKNEAFSAIVEPVVIDAAATLLFAAVMLWSHRSKKAPAPQSLD